MKHIYDWLDELAVTDDEQLAKDFLNEATKPAEDKDHEYLQNTRLTCMYKGSRYRCTGASRMGDVWICKDWRESTGYSKRVAIGELSLWEIKKSQK